LLPKKAKNKYLSVVVFNTNSLHLISTCTQIRLPKYFSPMYIIMIYVYLSKRAIICFESISLIVCACLLRTINVTAFKKFFEKFYPAVFTFESNRFFFSGASETLAFMTTVPAMYHCPKKCGRRYTRKDSLNRHVTYECGVEPQFKCSFCNKTCAQKYNLKKHMITVHNYL